MEPTLMQEVEVDPRAEEQARVHDWRVERLRDLGVPRVVADLFADQVDWRTVAALVERGCPAALAIDIVR
jgi:hypothetical protein